MWCAWKVRFLGLLMLGLASCQNGEANPVVEGSGIGSGEGEISTTTWMSTTKKPTTHRPIDTTTDAGSGDDEDGYINKTAVTTTTVKPTRPTDDEDGSGSGSGDKETVFTGVTTTPRPVDITNTANVLKTEANTETSTRPKTLEVTAKVTRMKTEESATTKSNIIEEEQTTSGVKVEVSTEQWNGIEVINSPTTKMNPSTRSRATTEMSNNIGKDRGQKYGENDTGDDLQGNVARQVGKGKGSGTQLYIKIGIIVGAVLGAVLIVYIIVLLVYRLRKKDEGSYSLEEPITGYAKQEPGSPVSGKEYFA